ncbi:MAG: nucleotide-binding protein [Gammaproteobacteria bacterium]|nr:nucleotide-binding protein [Gammaproteobacteria bacterium]
MRAAAPYSVVAVGAVPSFASSRCYWRAIVRSCAISESTSRSYRLQMGYFIGRLKRERVCVLYKGGVELPSDILGVVYHPIDDANGWKLSLAGELKRAGYEIDLNKIVA